MTTSLVTSPITNLTVEGFRAWTKQVSDQLQAVGLVRVDASADFATSALPAIGTYTAWEVYRFADTDPLQATRPVFLKIEYGTANNASYPTMRLSVGTTYATPGSGTVTGTFISNMGTVRNTGMSTSNYPSYCVYRPEEGYLAFIGWVGAAGAGANPSAAMAFSLSRAHDDAGAPISEAVVLGFLTGVTWATRSYSWLRNALLVESAGAYCLVPFFNAYTSTVIGEEASVYRHYTATPRVRHLPHQLTYWMNEFASLTPFTATVLGKMRTYMALGDAISGVATSTSTTHVLAIVWE